MVLAIQENFICISRLILCPVSEKNCDLHIIIFLKFNNKNNVIDIRENVAVVRFAINIMRIVILRILPTVLTINPILLLNWVSSCRTCAIRCSAINSSGYVIKG